MTEPAQPPSPAPPAPIPTVKVTQDIPVVFADTIASQSFGFGVTKMYLSRYDPDPGLVGPPKEMFVLQLVMPTENFVRTVAFLEHRLKQMVEIGAVTQALVDESRKFWRDQPTG
jgi:hypothetical protein